MKRCIESNRWWWRWWVHVYRGFIKNVWDFVLVCSFFLWGKCQPKKQKQKKKKDFANSWHDPFHMGHAHTTLEFWTPSQDSWQDTLLIVPSSLMIIIDRHLLFLALDLSLVDARAHTHVCVCVCVCMPIYLRMHLVRMEMYMRDGWKCPLNLNLDLIYR